MPFAYELYENADMESKRIAQGFKDTFCTPVSVDFVGVWCVPGCYITFIDSLPPRRDTVASVGLIRHKTLPFATSNDNIRVFRHALALDEVCLLLSQILDRSSSLQYYSVGYLLDPINAACVAR